VLGKKIEGEWVFLNLEDGVYYGLNETGSLIWDGLEEKRDLQGIVSRLQELSGEERETLEEDAEGFLADLMKAGLIRAEGAAAQA